MAKPPTAGYAWSPWAYLPSLTNDNDEVRVSATKHVAVFCGIIVVLRIAGYFTKGCRCTCK